MALVVLAILWAAFALYTFRDRSGNRPSASIGDFRRQLRVLGRSAPTSRPAPAPTSAVRSAVPAGGTIVALGRGSGRSAAGQLPAPTHRRHTRRSAKRRRDILLGLLVAMAGSLALGFVPGLRVLWMVHVVVDVLFVAYIGALVYMRNLADERQRKVRYLPSRTAQPALLYRRSAN